MAVYVYSIGSCSDAASELERVKLGVGWNLSVRYLVSVACVFASSNVRLCVCVCMCVCRELVSYIVNKVMLASYP